MSSSKMASVGIATALGLCCFAADSKPWVTYRSEAGHYSAKFPIEPKTKTSKKSFYGKEVKCTNIAYDQKTFGLLLMDNDLSYDYNYSGHEREFLERTLDAFRYKNDEKLLERKSFTWQGEPAIYTHSTFGKGEMYRYSVVHRSHYLDIIVCGAKGKVDMAIGQRFIASIKLE